MRFIPISRLLATALLAVALYGYQAKDEKSEAKTDQPKKASLEGTAIDAATGKPVKDTTLMLVRMSGTGMPLTAKANESGEFSFKDLDPAAYILIADHPRYARQVFGSRSGLMGASPVTIATGQAVKDIVFKLSPNAVASGRVLDEDGEPIAGVLVAALRPVYQRGRQQFLPLGTAQTNDLGEFRIANLAAGRYLLSANLMKPPAPTKPPGDAPEQAYVPTYYPNVTESAAAAKVEIVSGRDVAGLDIRLAKANSVRVKGQVAGAAKDQKITVRMVPKGAGLLAMIFGKNTIVKMPEGTFEIAGVTSGSYTLRATDATGIKALGMGVPVEVGDRPIEGIVVDVTPSGDITGSVTVRGENKEPLKGARVLLEPSEGVNMVPPNTLLAEDGAFTLKDVPPDKYFVRVMGAPGNAYVESVSVGNQEMAADGLQLGGINPGKVEVKLNMAGAQIDGVVQGKDDNPVAGATIALIPNSGHYLLYQSSFSDQKGAFSIKQIAPGEYRVLAFLDLEPNAFMDPEFMKQYEGKGERISVKENDRKGVSLKAN